VQALNSILPLSTLLSDRCRSNDTVAGVGKRRPKSDYAQVVFISIHEVLRPA